jgi:FKBP-type peptidyl-prolyl cis-trans isomerase
MNRQIFSLVILVLVSVACICSAADDTLTIDMEKVSYCIGVDIGTNFKNQSIDVDPDVLLMGMKDAFNGKDLKYNDEERKTILNDFRKVLKEKQDAKKKMEGEKNMAEGKAFLLKNKEDKDIVVLDSGLQYKVIVEGSGEKPLATDTVSVHYRGTLIDGTEFDSSYSRGQPAKFKVNGVIKGWSEALQLMKTGSKWKLYIPSDLAYGERGAGQKITSNATLVFDVELLEINPQ